MPLKQSLWRYLKAVLLIVALVLMVEFIRSAATAPWW